MQAGVRGVALVVLAMALAGCEARTLSLRALEYPIVLTANPFIGLAEPPHGAVVGTYAGEDSESVVSGGSVTTTTTTNTSQLKASEALGGQDDRTILNLVYDVDETYAVFYFYAGVKATGWLVELELPSAEEP